MGTLSKLRRMVLRDNVSMREAARRLGISRNTAKRYLEQPEMDEPRYPQRQSPIALIEPYKDQIIQWLKSDAHRNRRERRTIDAYFQSIRAMGYSGGKTQVYTFCQRWKQEQGNVPKGIGFVPLTFEMGEAFQFDWST
ncbi:IS21 family transposase, partial [Comamonas odontotermitis]